MWKHVWMVTPYTYQHIFYIKDIFKWTKQKQQNVFYRLLAWHSGYLLSMAIHLDAFSCNLNFPGLAFSNYGLAFFCWVNSRKSTSPSFISQTTDFHFAYKRFSFRSCRFSFRKLQHFVSPVSQSTPSLDLQARRKKWEPPLIHSKQAPPEIDINSKQQNIFYTVSINGITLSITE